MVQQKHTRKHTRKNNKKVKSPAKRKLTIPELRKAFEHMDNVVEKLRNTAKHSLSDAVVIYREEWYKTFKNNLSPADAAAYLKFKYEIKSSSKHTRRTKKRGGGMSSLGGAPLDYQLRPGVSGPYGHFPAHQEKGLDNMFSPAITADCNKDPSSQAGGGFLDGFFRPLAPLSPPSMGYSAMMTDPGKGTPVYPSSDPVGAPPLRTIQPVFSDKTFADQYLRSHSMEVYSPLS